MKTKKLNKCFFFMSLLVFAAACEDKLIYPPSGNGNSVKFSLENMSEKNALSRSFSDGGSLLPSGIVPLEAEDRTLYLHTSVSEGVDGSRLGKEEAVTRATPVSNMNTYGSFAVFAASYRGAWSPGSQNMNFMYHVPVSLSGGVWSPPADYHWPGSGHKVRFFAYAPIDAEFEASNQSAVANDFHIKYDVPADVSRQKDLLVAKSAEYPGNHGNSVPLQFKHVLTAVRFVVGDDMKAGTVNKIRLRNIASAGMYDPETGIGQASGTVKDFEQELNKVTGGTPGTAITEPFQTFMLPPQSFNDDSSVIEVVFTDDEGEHTLTASLKGQTWISGTTVTYTISTSSINWEYHLTVDGHGKHSYATAFLPHTGGTRQFSVSCYRVNGKGEREEIPWHVKYTTDYHTWTDTPPDWLNTDGTTPNSFNVTVGTNIPEDDNPLYNPHQTNLKNAPVKGSAGSPYNLANQTDGGSAIENTANCYVVSAPGHYSFPLVYGNAIKDGAPNISAYSFSVQNASEKRSLGTFINHLGNGITDPYISRNAGCVPAKAELVWQDALDLVTDIKYNNTADGNGNISFIVKRETIYQGNAIIAIKDQAGNVLWSWHIWVTDEDLSQTIEVTDKSLRKHEVMPVLLGWCDKSLRRYDRRECEVSFFSSVGNAEKVSRCIRQVEYDQRSTKGDAPQYQWGRKDPIISFIDDGWTRSDINKVRYYKDRVFPTGTDFGKVPYTAEAPEQLPNPATADELIMNGILKPDVLYPMLADINDLYGNLWWVNFHYENPPVNIVKTIYDPSPVGFQVPSDNVFDGLIPDHLTDNVVYLFTDASKNRTILFPMFGQRLPGIPSLLTYFGHYWTAAAGSDRVHSDGISVYISTDGGIDFTPKFGHYFEFGAHVRPVRE